MSNHISKKLLVSGLLTALGASSGAFADRALCAISAVAIRILKAKSLGIKPAVWKIHWERMANR